MWYLEAETEKSRGLPVPRRRATWSQRLRYLRVLLGVEDGSFATGTPAMAHAKVGTGRRAFEPHFRPGREVLFWVLCAPAGGV